MLNPFFQQGSKTEQNLVQDLINEQLKIYGVEIHYLPRFYITEKTVMREVIESRFDSSYPIEAYVQNVDGYGDNPTILSKFGIESTNEITLVISKERFNDYISPLIKNEQNVKLSSRPKEGDLLYFPLGDRLFEIKYVEHEKPFYQLQENYVYELRCELFQYEDEIIDTGVSEIDDLLEGVEGVDGEEIFIGRTQTLTLVGAGVTAEAITSIVDGGIRLITVNNRGGGYTSPPRVAISAAPNAIFGGVTGIASAVMIGGIVACNKNLSSNEKSVQSVQIVNPGAGYTVTPKVQFFSSSGVGAAATASIGDGIVGIITVTNTGSGYVDPPTITFANEIFESGVTTVSAAATAILNNAGIVTSIRLTNAGLGYSTAPTIVIGNPSTSGVGTFAFNETVTGSVTGATARVRTWNANTSELEISNIVGSFSSGETLTGGTSNASYEIRIVDRSLNDGGFNDNDDIESEADAILDFEESNPFGVP
jgi:hypothetical protein|tara:strand:- start:1631 stop:3070 length:1440 start_codon:yes stop_codon:yes gene_type:complete